MVTITTAVPVRRGVERSEEVDEAARKAANQASSVSVENFRFIRRAPTEVPDVDMLVYEGEGQP